MRDSIVDVTRIIGPSLSPRTEQVDLQFRSQVRDDTGYTDRTDRGKRQRQSVIAGLDKKVLAAGLTNFSYPIDRTTSLFYADDIVVLRMQGGGSVRSDVDTTVARYAIKNYWQGGAFFNCAEIR